jgi:hypothetical protein
MVTGEQMCQKISKWLKETQNIDIKPIDIWEYSPTGELIKVFELYEIANDYFYQKEHSG